MDDVAEIKLTGKQRQMLKALAEWRGPDVPTAGELAPLSGYADESGARMAFRVLEGAGMLEVLTLRGSTLRIPTLTEKARRALGLAVADAPVVLALPEKRSAWERLATTLKVRSISCGPLSDAEDAEEEEIDDPREFFTHWDELRDYPLRGRGDSMVDVSSPLDSIFDGDWIQVRTGIKPGNGEYVHAEYERGDGGHECTLKVFHMDAHTGVVTLTPLNAAFETIVLPGERVEVRGVVKEWLSRRSRGKSRK